MCNNTGSNAGVNFLFTQVDRTPKFILKLFSSECFFTQNPKPDFAKESTSNLFVFPYVDAAFFIAPYEILPDDSKCGLNNGIHA